MEACVHSLFLNTTPTAGNDNAFGQNVSGSQQPGTTLQRDMQYERGPLIGSGNNETSSGLQSKAGATGYETGHNVDPQNGDVVSAGVQTGVKGVDNVKQGEVIDRKFYTGREARPQEQALGKQHTAISFVDVSMEVELDWRGKPKR